jgi:ketosteroid isomerase-like protein
MSQQNVEMVRAVMEAYQHPEMLASLVNGEFDLELAESQIEWDASRLDEMITDLAEIHWGQEGVRMYWRRWFEAWKDLQFEIQDVLDAGDDVVVLIRNQRQWGRHTGICTELPPYAQGFTVREGKVVRWRTFPNQESAMAVVSLSPGEE